MRRYIRRPSLRDYVFVLMYLILSYIWWTTGAWWVVLLIVPAMFLEGFVEQAIKNLLEGE